jgi:hypothetical protein
MRLLFTKITLNTKLIHNKEFYYKIVNYNGEILRNESSPEGYTTSDYEIQNVKNEDLLFFAFGNSDYSIYPPGKYFIEVYCEYNLLLSETVEIHPDIQVT